jgi:hypothetical protein
MVAPPVLSWVEKMNGLSCFAVNGCLPVGFAAVAVEASQRQILERVFAAFG